MNRMSIIIKGVNPPRSCWDCTVYYGMRIDCPTLRGETSSSQHKNDRPNGCPIIEVPSHSRLIDANRLKADNPKHMDQDVPYVTEETVEEIIDDAPTVIEED